MDNRPAFPNHPGIQLGDDYQGMSLRDWFAGQALGGLTSSGDTVARASRTADAEAYLASWAYRIADAMLAERCEDSSHAG